MLGLLVMNNGVIANQWTQPYNTYLFAPGIISSEHQAGKYCLEYTASTGQKIVTQHGNELINGPYTHGCNFAEISLVKLALLLYVQKSWMPYALLLNQIYKTAHSILTTSNNRYQISIEGEPKNGLTLDPYLLNIFKMNFGQLPDVVRFSSLYDRYCDYHEDAEDIVLFGTSRGAVTLINFMALEYVKKSCKKVRALVLEGCYGSLDQLTHFSFLISLGTLYKYNGISPLHPAVAKAFVAMCNIYNIPILFVGSSRDLLVPIDRTRELCDVLKKNGLRDLYLLPLENSGHSAYLKDDIHDTHLYKVIVHAFYQKYNLSHDSHLAAQGAALLEQLRY